LLLKIVGLIDELSERESRCVLSFSFAWKINFSRFVGGDISGIRATYFEISYCCTSSKDAQKDSWESASDLLKSDKVFVHSVAVCNIIVRK